MNRFSSLAKSGAVWLIRVIGLTTIGLARPALAQGRYPCSIVYRAPQECPDRSTFVGLLTRRIPLDWFTSDASSAPTFAITLETEEDEFVARLEGRTAESRLLLRTVRAKRCEEAVSGIALVTALAMEALQTDHAGAEVALGVEPEQTSAMPPEDATARAPPKPTKAALRMQAPESRTTSRRSPAAGTHPWFTTHEVALRFALANGLGPAAAKGAGVEWGIGRRPFLPLLRLAASWKESRSAAANREDNVHFRLIAGELDGCLGWTLIEGPRLLGAICAGIELGRYTAEGVPSDPKRVQGSDFAMLWASGVGSLHLRTAGAGMFLDVAPELRVPWVRREFIAMPSNVSIHSVPAVSVGAIFSLGMTFD